MPNDVLLMLKFYQNISKDWQDEWKYLFVHEAMEDEDEDALKAVEDREDISHDDWVSVDVEETKRPRRTEQYDQHYCTFYPRPNKRHNLCKATQWRIQVGAGGG